MLNGNNIDLTNIDMNKELKFYKKNGYIYLRNFFSNEEVNTILKEAKNIFLKQFINKNFIPHCKLEDLNEKEFNSNLFRLFQEDVDSLTYAGKQIQHLISLHLLSLSPKIISLLKNIGLTSPIICTRPVVFFNHSKLSKSKVYHTVDAHQDWRSMQGSLNSVVLWIPLVDIDRDLGALEILPGSHLSGLRTNHIENGFGMVNLTKDESNNLKSVEIKVGDALLFSSFLVHKSGNNISDIPRWSCHFRYNDLDDNTFIKRKYPHPYIYKPSDELITRDFPMKEDLFEVFK